MNYRLGKQTTMKKGSNNARHVVWAPGKCVFSLFFYRLTIVLLDI